MAADGKSREEIKAGIDELIPKVRASFVVDTLVYLYRGGRCNAVSALIGGALALHPMIVVKDGKMDASRKYRGKIGKVIKNYAKDLEEDLKNAIPDRVFITHSECDAKTVEEVREYIASLGIFKEITLWAWHTRSVIYCKIMEFHMVSTLKPLGKYKHFINY